MAKQLKVTQKRSVIGQTERQRASLRGLGLRKPGHTVVREDTPQNRGMINKVSHLVEWEELQNG